MHFDGEANPDLLPSDQMRAIGYAEGVLFHEHIRNHFLNIREYFLRIYLDNASDFADDIYAYFHDNLAWVRSHARNGASSGNPFWA